MFKQVFASVVSVCLLSSAAGAAEKWTVEDILFQERVQTVELSPDAQRAVYSKTVMDKEKGVNISNLFLKSIADGAEVALTRGKDTNIEPKFSPDGKLIAFLSSRKPSDAPAKDEAGGGGLQIWLIDLRGGEAYPLTKFEKGIQAFDWADANTIIASASEDSTLYDQQVKERKDTSNPVDDEQHAAPVRLFRIPLKGSPARITTNKDRITSVDVSPDGAWAVTNHNRSLHQIYDQKIKPVTFLTDLKTGKSTQLFTDGKLLADSFAWARDSKGFYFTAPRSNHPYLYDGAIDLLYYYDVAASKLTQVPLQWENGSGNSVSTTPDGFVVALPNGARDKAARYVKNGETWTQQWISGGSIETVAAIKSSADGKRVVYSSTTASKPLVWMIAKLEGAALQDAKPLVELNTGWKNKPIAKSEVITWKGAQNEQVEGILYYPTNYEAGKKYPLVLMIHGGPHGRDRDAFNETMFYPHQLYTQRGAFILKPNYHGSSGYGLKWGESISGGKYNDLEWIDCNSGVDAVIAKGLVDPEKLGVMGWSNGSIITIELTTRTTRFKAAGAGAGDVNWTSDWGNAVFGDSFEQYYLGKTPMDDPELYIRKSPLFRMNKVKTPTIIFFGTEDKQVPTEQGWQHYRALQHYGNTDVKFILFPGEQHGPRKLVHQQRKMEEELAWFDKHLFGTLTDRNEALRPGSPLDGAVKRAKAPNTPDLVEQPKFWIGRFEVTRAQFHEFDSSYSVAAGTENYPANGVTYEKAVAYCDWLSKKTGQKFRLGTEEEMKPLLKASKTENTLDRWAGYTVNVDDATRLGSLIDG